MGRTSEITREPGDFRVIPYHQSSFCWICLPLLTLSIIRSSCPPSHHWKLLGFHFAGLNPISLGGLQGGLGRGGIQSTSIGHWGSPGLGSWTPPFFHIHYITGSHHTGTWLLLPFLCWWHTALSLISTWWSNGSCTDPGCLADISAWMKEHHLQLNLAKTKLLVFPATPNLQHDFSIQIGSSTITPSASVRNLGVIFDDQLTFKEHIAKTARFCRFALHNIRPFLTERAAQLLVQALVISRLDYCNALLAGLPSNTIKPLQMIQNAAARLGLGIIWILSISIPILLIDSDSFRFQCDWIMISNIYPVSLFSKPLHESLYFSMHLRDVLKCNAFIHV